MWCRFLSFKNAVDLYRSGNSLYRSFNDGQTLRNKPQKKSIKSLCYNTGIGIVIKGKRVDIKELKTSFDEISKQVKKETKGHPVLATLFNTLLSLF